MSNKSVFIKNEETGEIISLKGWVSIAAGETKDCLIAGVSYMIDAGAFFGIIEGSVKRTMETSSQTATFSLSK